MKSKFVGAGSAAVGAAVIVTVLATAAPGVGAQSLVSTGAVWKYLANGSDPGTAWRASGFDDSTWASGPAQLGYGDGDEATVVNPGPDPNSKYITTYFRRAFSVAEASTLGSLTLRVLRDDGVVVYLNGVEVFRNNLPSGPISFHTLATVSVGGAEESTLFVATTLDAAPLVTGDNVVAAEIHQVNPVSSDISFDLELLATGGPPNTNLPPTVRLVAPMEGAVFNGPTNIQLLASANDPNGYLTLQQVEFFEGGHSLGVRTNFPTLNPVGPFVLQWTNVPLGEYTLTAVATDDHAAQATSAPVHVTVRTAPVTNISPRVSILTPTNGASFIAPAMILLGAHSEDPDGNVLPAVEFFANGTSLGLAGGPFRTPQGEWLLTWSNAPSGDYTLSAVATDEGGATGTSAPVHITVQGQPPGDPGACLPRVEWQASYGGSGLEYLYSVRQLPDAGYILGGTSTSGADGNKTTLHLGDGHDFDWWVVRIDSTGAIVWQKSLGSPDNDVLLALERTAGGGFIVGGYRRGGYFSAAKLSAQGDVLWEREYEDGAVASIQQLPDGGFVLAGWTYAGGVPGDDPELGGGGGTNFRILRIDPNGNVIWDRRFGGNAIDQAYAVRQTPDGGFLLGGTSNSGISGNKTAPNLGNGSADFWVIRLDANGNRLWERTYGSDGFEDLRALEITPDGGAVLGGGATGDWLLVRIAADGGELWRRTYSGDDSEGLYALRPLADGGFILGGNSTSGASGDKSSPNFGEGYSDYWLLRVDADGNKLWDQSFGGDRDDYLYAMDVTADGGLILGGLSASGISGNKTVPSLSQDYWLVKLAPPGCDADGDGVPDERDQCANTPPGGIVNAHGCSIAQLCPCGGPWHNHGDYVNCVIHHAWQFFRDGLITADQRRAIVRDAGHSDCGRHSPAAEPVQILLLPITPEECHQDGVQFVVCGPAAGNCIIETSPDLVHWTALQTLDAGDMGREVACPHSSSERSIFFRVRVE